MARIKSENNMDNEHKYKKDDEIFFTPDEIQKSIELALNKLEQARREFLKVAEGMKPDESGELRVES